MYSYQKILSFLIHTNRSTLYLLDITFYISCFSFIGLNKTNNLMLKINRNVETYNI